VINRIRAEFFFKDGLIIRHTDDFDIWKWSKQALGTGHLLGWTGYMQKKINENALHSQKYQKLLHDTSNFKDNFQARFKSTKTRN
jgi:predicted negative regulator of RcsB-dependent stress response